MGAGNILNSSNRKHIKTSNKDNFNTIDNFSPDFNGSFDKNQNAVRAFEVF